MTSKYLLPLTGLDAMVFSSWLLARHGVGARSGLDRTGRAIWQVASRYLAPIGVIAAFISSL